jgi:hypothetical protein
MDTSFSRCDATMRPPPLVAIVTVVTVVGGNFLHLVDHIGRSFAQRRYPILPPPAQEAAPFIVAVLLIQWQHQHCHKAARAEANLSVLGNLPRIGSGGSNRFKVVLCSVHRGKFGKSGQYLFQSVEPTCVALGTDHISTPYNKRQESQRETQLSVLKLNPLIKLTYVTFRYIAGHCFQTWTKTKKC